MNVHKNQISQIDHELSKLVGLKNLDICGFEKADDQIIFHAIYNKKVVCPYCKSQSLYVHDKTTRKFTDLPLLDKKCIISLEQIRYKCVNPICSHFNHTFLPEIPCLSSNRDRTTTRLREAIVRQISVRTLSDLAAQYFLSHTAIKSIFMDVYKEAIESSRYPEIRILGIDEAHLNNIMRGVLVDQSDSGAKLLDILPDNKKETVQDALKRIKSPEKVDVVTMDMSASYRSAVEYILPWAKIVVDRFHVVKLLLKSMDQCKNEYIAMLAAQAKENHTIADSIGLNHYWLKADNEHLSKTSKQKLARILKNHPILAEIYKLKEEFRYIYTSQNRAEAEKRYQNWIVAIPDGKIFEPYRKFIKTVKMWHNPIFNYFEFHIDSRYSNGPVEAINGEIKRVMRNGRGYSFEMLRYKLIYDSPWVERITVRCPDEIEVAYQTLARLLCEKDFIWRGSYYEAVIREIFAVAKRFNECSRNTALIESSAILASKSNSYKCESDAYPKDIFITPSLSWLDVMQSFEIIDHAYEECKKLAIIDNCAIYCEQKKTFHSYPDIIKW